MSLKFKRILSLFENMDTFGAVKGGWTFIITEDREHEAGVLRASVKPIGAVPFDEQRSDLGVFSSFKAAEIACNAFYRKRNN